jgi:crossover junction endodeoxyribonuclease RusA
MDEAMEQESPELNTGEGRSSAMESRKSRGRLEITLPWPPSVGSMWRIFRNRWVLSPKGREYRVAVEEQIKLQNVAVGIKNPIKVEIIAYRPDKRKRDLDNLLKGSLDSLTKAGVWEDDSLIQDLRIYWGDHIGGYLKVYIEEYHGPAQSD